MRASTPLGSRRWEELGVWDRLHADLPGLLEREGMQVTDVVIVDTVLLRLRRGDRPVRSFRKNDVGARRCPLMVQKAPALCQHDKISKRFIRRKRGCG